jgi:hypothetical protein
MKYAVASLIVLVTACHSRPASTVREWVSHVKPNPALSTG